MLQRGGLAWQGGLVTGTLTALFLMKKKRMPVASTLDLLAPYIALGQAIGRLGCFLNGCCYGKEVSWGIFFPVYQAYLHPTQLYDSLGLFVLFIILKKYEKVNTQKGSVFILYIILASVQRFFIQFYRADHIPIFMGLSIFQISSLIIIAMAIYAYLYFKRR